VISRTGSTKKVQDWTVVVAFGYHIGW